MYLQRNNPFLKKFICVKYISITNLNAVKLKYVRVLCKNVSQVHSAMVPILFNFKWLNSSTKNCEKELLTFLSIIIEYYYC